MEKSDLNSKKMTTIQKGTEIKVLDILNNGWSYIESLGRNGYVLSETLSNINPLNINKIDIDENDNVSKDKLLENLNFEINVGKPSGCSLEQFRKVLVNNPNDKNGIFSDNADYFYYAEKEYGINGIFLASLAIHESGWGTSKIALDKKNLFGYQAYDDTAYQSSKTFNTYSEGIDLVSRVLIKYYLNSSGTEIYGGDIADGKYFFGNTISDVNKNYATDPNWSISIFKIMKELYSRI